MTLTSKAVEKKKYILLKATNVFIKRGYTAVTMKDIVEECKISRGGLYRYYGSPKEVFEDILSAGKQEDSSTILKGIDNETNAVEILKHFLQQQKKELLNIKDSLRIAIYEFYLSQQNNDLQEVFSEATSIISRVLSYGIERKDIIKLDSSNVEKTARHIIIVLEGLNILAMITSISPEIIQEQIDVILNLII